MLIKHFKYEKLYFLKSSVKFVTKVKIRYINVIFSIIYILLEDIRHEMATHLGGIVIKYIILCSLTRGLEWIKREIKVKFGTRILFQVCI